MICLPFSLYLSYFIYLFYLEMTLPSVASCDSARTHPPFLASSRPPKNLRNEPWFVYYIKHINSIRKQIVFDPFQGGGPFGPIFLE